MDTADKAKFVLQKALVVEQDRLNAQYLWVWEPQRWHELVVAFMMEVVSLPENDIRRLVDYLVDLDLLDIPGLAAAGSEPSHERRRRIVNLLSEQGVKPEEAEAAAQLMVEAASGLQAHFRGSLSDYLRSYAEAMLGDIRRYFSFSVIDEGKAREAFVYWLQNTLGMPISLSRPEITEFCEHHGLTEAELIAAADGLGLNLAVLDDLILLDRQRHRTPRLEEAAARRELESAPER